MGEVGARGPGGPTLDAWMHDHADMPVESVPISALVEGASPRLSGENSSHIESLASSTIPLSPILVHRPTMRVIDGMHRLRAANLRKQLVVDVRYFDGSADEAFVLSVFTNVSHGMPLSLKDRKAAAGRILDRYPAWSDRLVAHAAGLSHTTVAGIRRRAGGRNGQLNGRLGRDGKTHPLTNIEGRRAAAKLIEADGSASLREVARQAGVSTGTVRDVRARLAKGDEPVPQMSSRSNVDGKRPSGIVRKRAEQEPSSNEALELLRADPALRFSEHGRTLVRLLTMTTANASACFALTASAPAYCRPTIAIIASAIASAWTDLAASISAQASNEFGDDAEIVERDESVG